MVRISNLAVVASYVAGLALAHPGHDVRDEIAQRAAYMAKTQYRSLDHCADQLKTREAERVARRKATVEKLRMKRSLKARDLEDVLAKNHHSDLDVTPDSPHDLIFAANASCILSPEVTEGPYYVGGELVRKDITNSEAGVPLFVDFEVIDVNTCEPLPSIALEYWSCNSTGVYGGVVAGGNGNGDASNLNNTAHRGIQFTGDDGVAEFEAIFPGHYTGRAVHVHTMAHINPTLLPNNTITGGTVSHVGQIYFDQTLIGLVEAVAPYNTNRQPLTTNARDGILAQGAAGENDPIVNYVLLGDSIEDGVFSWITFGLDSTNVIDVHEAVHWGENGGVPNTVGGPGGPGGPGFPTGPPPSFPTA